MEEKENSTWQDENSAEALEKVSERRVYYTRSAKRREEARQLKRSNQNDEEDMWRAEQPKAWQMEAKKYKNTYPDFKRKMINSFGETFFYNGGSWHGELSSRYRHYHIRKSMHFLQSNMKSDEA